jgi:hypothetical protein
MDNGTVQIGTIMFKATVTFTSASDPRDLIETNRWAMESRGFDEVTVVSVETPPATVALSVADLVSLGVPQAIAEARVSAANAG